MDIYNQYYRMRHLQRQKANIIYCPFITLNTCPANPGFIFFKCTEQK